MWDIKKRSILLVVFILSSLGVLSVRWMSEQQQLATVQLLTHDGDMLAGGLHQAIELLSTGQYQGVFYEGNTGQYLLPFQGQPDPSLVVKLQQAADLPWYNLTPDTLFLRAFSNSYAQMLRKMEAQQLDSLNALGPQKAALKRRAVWTKDASKDSLMMRLHHEIDLWSEGQSTKLRQRYADQMLNKFSMVAFKQPGKRWLMLIDVAHYAEVKGKLQQVKRVAWDE